MEKKFEIHPTGEKLLFGKNIIELTDMSRGKFTTHSLQDFRKAVNNDYVVYVDGTNLTAYKSGEVLEPEYRSEPFAVCNLLINPILQILRQRNKSEMDLALFGEFIRSMKPYLVSDSLSLLDALSDLKIKKIVDIEQQSDRRGNFCFSVKAEKGKADYEFPLQVGFKVPLFDGDDDRLIELYYELIFTWAVADASVDLSFKLVNYSQETLITKQMKNEIEAIFKDSGIQIFSGKFEVMRMTNEFAFKESNITL